MVKELDQKYLVLKLDDDFDVDYFLGRILEIADDPDEPFLKVGEIAVEFVNAILIAKEYENIKGDLERLCPLQ